LPLPVELKYVLNVLMLLQFTQCGGSEFQYVVNHSITRYKFSDIRFEPSFEEFVIMSTQAVIINFKK